MDDASKFNAQQLISDCKGLIEMLSSKITTLDKCINAEEEYDDEEEGECCHSCGCYHSHFNWCVEYSD